ncbi:MAG TPA: AI-2E family transporter [Dehalococcoidia bacterium]|nr:AI-2E family transporter [Dehalococcoidia bacterium]
MLKIEISARGVVVIALALLALWALIELWPVILLLLVSLVLMIGLLPFVEWLVSKGIARPYAVLLLLLVFVVAVVALFSYMVPVLVEEFDDVRDNLPESAREIEELLANFGINVELQERARNIDWGEVVSGRAAVDVGQRVLALTVSLITIVVMTAYLLADTPRLGNFISQFIPPQRRGELERLFQSMTRVVGGYLRGQAITSLAIAVYTFVLLRILGVPNPLAFAVLAGFADVIPLVGALIATVPPAAAALQDSATRALAVLIGLVAYQQFEDRFLVPRVYGRTLNLPPVIVLIAVLAGAELLGIVGVLLALPLTAAARVALDYLIESRQIVLPADSQAAQEAAEGETASDQPFAPDVADEASPETPGGEASRAEPTRPGRAKV